MSKNVGFGARVAVALGLLVGGVVLAKPEPAAAYPAKCWQCRGFGSRTSCFLSGWTWGYKTCFTQRIWFDEYVCMPSGDCINWPDGFPEPTY